MKQITQEQLRSLTLVQRVPGSIPGKAQKLVSKHAVLCTEPAYIISMTDKKTSQHNAIMCIFYYTLFFPYCWSGCSNDQLHILHPLPFLLIAFVVAFHNNIKSDLLALFIVHVGHSSTQQLLDFGTT